MLWPFVSRARYDGALKALTAACEAVTKAEEDRNYYRKMYHDVVRDLMTPKAAVVENPEPKEYQRLRQAVSEESVSRLEKDLVRLWGMDPEKAKDHALELMREADGVAEIEA